MTMLHRPKKNAGEGVGHKIEKHRGGRVPLTQASAVNKEITNMTIHRDRGMPARDQLHYTMHISPVEAFRKQDLP